MNSVGMYVFSVNQLENNGTLGNQESFVYCLLTNPF